MPCRAVVRALESNRSAKLQPNNFKRGRNPGGFVQVVYNYFQVDGASLIFKSRRASLQFSPNKHSTSADKSHFNKSRAMTTF